MSRIKRKQRGLLSQKREKKEGGSSKWAVQSLVFSVALNVALLTSLIFNAVKFKGPIEKYTTTHPISQAPSTDLSQSLENTLMQFLSLDERALINLLGSKVSLEDGFCECDIALSVLRNQFDFDLKRALLGQEFKERFILISNQESLNVSYPIVSGLTNSQYQMVETFAQNELWPLTSQGLYKKLAQGLEDTSLKNAFYLSKEFLYVEGLFRSLSVPKEVLIKIILQGPWEILEGFTNERAAASDINNPARLKWLCKYLDFGSELAAQLILEIDPEHALKKLSDNQVVALLSLLEKRSNLSENFALHLSVSQRSDWVRQEACRLLYHYASRPFPEVFNYEEALQYISQKYQVQPSENIPQLSTQPVIVAEPPENSQKHYTVQDGDNLWKIAKKHQVKLDVLKAANGLDSDLIKVGKTLIIP